MSGIERRADRPVEIPGAGWWSILKRVYRALGSKHLSIMAAGVAFYGFLSIFPALVALVSIYGLVADPTQVQRELGSLHGVIPSQAQAVITDQLQAIVNSAHSRLGLSLLIGVIVALWSTRAGTVTMMRALNIVYEKEDRRSLLSFETLALGITVAGVIFAIIAFALVAVIPAIIGFLPIGHQGKSFLAIVRWPILIVLIAIAMSALYRIAPARKGAKWRWVSWGGGVATALWIAGSVGFSFYVSKFGNYDKTFGSLGAVVILLTWFYLSAYVVLLGALLNAEIERQPKFEAAGTDRPMGRRGVKIADTVAGDP